MSGFRPQTLGLIGFGAFGQLIAKHLRGRFELYVYDPCEELAHIAETAGGQFCSFADAAACDVVVIAAPVARLEEVARDVAMHCSPGALILDVGSVKIGPAEIMQRVLPDTVDIIATHPLFGPQSAADGLRGLKIALCPIRGGRHRTVAAFLRQALGLDVIITTADAHDREAAVVQGLTHLIAKVLVEMQPLPAKMTTRSFDLLIEAVSMVQDDAPEVFEAIVAANPYTADVRQRFFELARAVSDASAAPVDRA